MAKSLIVAVFVFIAVGSANALPYMTETVRYNQFVAMDFHRYDYVSMIDINNNYSPSFGGYGNYWFGNGMSEQSLAWSHTLPGDLSVPGDVIQRARLWIDGYSVDNHGNVVQVQGMAQWNLNSWDFLGFGDNTMIDLTGITNPDFWNQGALNVNVLANERSLRIDRAVLAVDYVSAIPEPLTLSLFGLGLVGVVVARRKFQS
jgi:hypothetical protein